MPTGTTLEYPCSRCGEQIHWSSTRGHRPKYCGSCKTIVTTERWKATLVGRPPATACCDCGDTLLQPTTAWRKLCPLCRVQHLEDVRRRASVRKRARKKGGEAGITIAYLMRRDNQRCQLCGTKVSAKRAWPDPQSGSVDHIVPLSRGGTHTKANVQLAHLACNLDKRARAVGEQLRLIG